MVNSVSSSFVQPSKFVATCVRPSGHVDTTVAYPIPDAIPFQYRCVVLLSRRTASRSVLPFGAEESILLTAILGHYWRRSRLIKQTEIDMAKSWRWCLRWLKIVLSGLTNAPAPGAHRNRPACRRGWLLPDACVRAIRLVVCGLRLTRLSCSGIPNNDARRICSRRDAHSRRI